MNQNLKIDFLSAERPLPVLRARTQISRASTFLGAPGLSSRDTVLSTQAMRNEPEV